MATARPTPWICSALLALGVAPLFPAMAAAAAWTNPDETKITAADAEAFDAFGAALAFDGTTAIIGAALGDDDGTNSGAAYLFDALTATPIAKLTAGDADGLDRFGVSVDIADGKAIVGSYFDDDLGSDSGSAYVFDASTGQQLVKLRAVDGAANDRFGGAVGLSGNVAIVGAALDDDDGSRSGSAYLFDATTGAHLFKLTALDAATDDRFGTAVAIDGTAALVGSLRDDDLGDDSGAAWVFDTTNGAAIVKLRAADGDAGDNFGAAVAISGAVALVGSPLDDDQGSDSGAAYLFDAATGAQLHKLLPQDGAAGAQFGASVAIAGGLAVVGAPFDDAAGSGAGAAYVFDVATGAQLGKLAARDAAADASFGAAVAVSRGRALVGAPQEGGAAQEAGAVYRMAPVPLPAGLWLLGPALGLLMLGRCRSA